MKTATILHAFVVLSMALASCRASSEIEPAPSLNQPDTLAVVDAYYEAFRAGDAEGLSAILSDDITFTITRFGPSSTISGKEEYLHSESLSFAANAQITYSNHTVQGDTFSAEHSYEAGPRKISGVIEIVVKDGKIAQIVVEVRSSEIQEGTTQTLEPVGTPLGPTTGLAALSPGWTPLSPGGETACALNTPYSFWVRPGTSDELLIFLQGGGYCDSAENCQLGSPTYDSAVTEGDDPALHPFGIFDFDNTENPFRDYSMVFIPYCTGDGHMGNNVQVYEADDGSELQVSHRGFANASAALEWVYENFESSESIFLTGCSAGSVGSVMHAAYVIEQYPEAAINQLGDSLAFVFDEPVNLQTGGKWQDNFPEWVEGMPDLMNRSFEISEFYSLVAGHYPDVGFGQLNSLYDDVQVSTYVEFGGQEQNWVTDFEASLSAIHANAPNFHSLTFGGTEHCMLDRPIFYEYAVEGIRLRDWVADYATGLDVRSVHCSECDEAEIVE